MNIFQQLLTNNLNDLKGMSVTGKIPLDTALVNRLLAEWIQSGSEGLSKTTGIPATAGLSYLEVLRHHLKEAEVMIEDGKLMVYFEWKVE